MILQRQQKGLLKAHSQLPLGKLSVERKRFINPILV